MQSSPCGGIDSCSPPLVAELREKASGSAGAQLVLSHWETLEEVCGRRRCFIVAFFFLVETFLTLVSPPGPLLRP